MLLKKKLGLAKLINSGRNLIICGIIFFIIVTSLLIYEGISNNTNTGTTIGLIISLIIDVVISYYFLRESFNVFKRDPASREGDNKKIIRHLRFFIFINIVIFIVMFICSISITDKTGKYISIALLIILFITNKCLFSKKGLQLRKQYAMPKIIIPDIVVNESKLEENLALESNPK